MPNFNVNTREMGQAFPAPDELIVQLGQEELTLQKNWTGNSTR